MVSIENKYCSDIKTNISLDSYVELSRINYNIYDKLNTDLLTLLPNEILVNIILNLNTKEIVTLSEVSSKLRIISNYVINMMLSKIRAHVIIACIYYSYDDVSDMEILSRLEIGSLDDTRVKSIIKKSKKLKLTDRNILKPNCYDESDSVLMRHKCHEYKMIDEKHRFDRIEISIVKLPSTHNLNYNLGIESIIPFSSNKLNQTNDRINSQSYDEIVTNQLVSIYCSNQLSDKFPSIINLLQQNFAIEINRGYTSDIYPYVPERILYNGEYYHILIINNKMYRGSIGSSDVRKISHIVYPDKYIDPVILKKTINNIIFNSNKICMDSYVTFHLIFNND